MTLSKWVVSGDKKPEPFDLVTMAFENGRQQPGWWTGSSWDSGKAMKGDQVVAWVKVGNSVGLGS